MNITTNTQLCGVLGNPIEHSLSPAIHNAAFQHLGMDFVYLAFLVEEIKDAVSGIRALGNLRGFSVTIPHKVSVIPFLDDVDPTARHIGAINTIVKDHGRLKGYNTDASGALRALRESGVSLERENILILGSGGAARAIAFGLAMEADIAHLTVLGIDEQERTGLVKDLIDRTKVEVSEGRCQPERVEEALHAASLLIHLTPVGMTPNVGGTCIPKEFLDPHLSVMDVVYNPLETRLLREAREAGCRTIQGIEMFLYQAVAQFELWTGCSAPTQVMRGVLESRFA